MNKCPKVSIVTVTYNCVGTVEQTICNVLGQTYPNIEYSVIDGASTDGTREVIEKYASRLDYWVSEPDKGIYDAMNKGIKAATGEWILFRNAGDYFFKLTTVEDVFNWYEERGEDLITGGMRCFNSHGYKDTVYKYADVVVWQNAYIKHPATFIRLSIQKSEMYPTDYKIASDYYFFQKLVLRGASMAEYDGIIALFDNETGISSTNILQSWQEITDIRKRLGAPWKVLLKSKIRCLCIRIRNLMK